jgi:hypothetical protein
MGGNESGRAEVGLRIAVVGDEMRRYFVYYRMTLHRSTGKRHKSDLCCIAAAVPDKQMVHL